MAPFKPSYKGIGEMLVMPGMVTDMGARAARAEAKAVAEAPKDTGEYASRFGSEAGIRTEHSKRAFGRVFNTDDAALQIEEGTSKTPAHHTLLRSIDGMRG